MEHFNPCNQILLTLKSLFVTTLLKVSAEASSDVVPIFGFDGIKLVKSFPKRKFSQASKHIGEWSFVDTLIKYFCSGVKGSRFLVRHYVPFFFQTKPTFPSGNK